MIKLQIINLNLIVPAKKLFVVDNVKASLRVRKSQIPILSSVNTRYINVEFTMLYELIIFSEYVKATLFTILSKYSQNKTRL